eukprot:TRINITY_DN38082_c0_g1_i1.p1 TRINITY_DN38082_c0_g1~~TRINITY_DN38082_c0_g1_i1.p1  ORF type:complete len:352 (-),score=90.60 TRINITY_DN38082_c0_g1_i1:25-1080(-)
MVDAGQGDPPSSSALLDELQMELLAEAEALRPASLEIPRLQARDDFALGSSSLNVSELGAPSSAHATDQRDGSLSPLSQQIADLCVEMDSCLGSLDEWRRQGSQRCEELKRELEKEYGFSYEDISSADDCWVLQDADEADMSTAAGTAGHTAVSSEAPAPAGGESTERRRETPPHKPYGLPLTASALESREDLERRQQAIATAVAMASEEEARLARLRIEVAELKRQSEQQASSLSSELGLQAGHRPSLEAPASGSLNLSGSCDEVDSLLGSFTEAGGDGANNDEERQKLQLMAMERRLQEAQLSVLEAEQALDSARGRLNGQVSEIEALLLECTRMGDSLDAGAETDAAR